MADDKKERPVKDEKEEKPVAPPAELSGTKKVMVMVGIVAGLLAILIVVTVSILGKLTQKQDPEVIAEEMRKQKEEVERKKMTEMGETLKTPITVVVNLGSDAERFLKTDLVLEYEASAEGGGGGGHGEGKSEGDPEIVKRLPKIKQIAIDVLSSKTFEDMKDPEGRKKVLTLLKNEMNKTFPEPEKIKNVYFNTFIIQ
ncbi:MAG: flagellar basal body-associated FliL family protein [Fibrobacterota bacterium]